ncbi:glycosyl hydrolase family 28-related protein [Sphingomonas sp.]|uniref:glycosyl hydrolase family 28-related protein n=1 Tax=Sphingomonas sp. TaxID=28214 RepID=UPI0025F3085B|nr:glycosyl hydrolase family 28-related protein [Sphingomonas sp.]
MISVLTYGAVGNGVTDDTTAIRNAITAAGATGGIVSFPAGTYKISGTLTISSANVMLIGEGVDATKIVSTNTAADILNFYASPAFSGGGVRDMTLEVSGSATAGAAIRINGQRSIGVENIWIRTPFQGVVLEGDNRACRIRNVDISDHLGNGFVIGGGGNQYLHTCTTFRNAQGGGTVAFLVTQTDGAWFDTCVSQRASYGMRVVPGATQYVTDLWINACDFDNSASDGVVFDSGTAGGRITTVNWNGSRIGFGGFRGLVIDGSQTQDLQFSNLRSEKNISHGLVIGNVQDAQFSNAAFLGNNATNAATETYGVNVIGGNGVVFSGGRSGGYSGDANNQKYGIVFGGTYAGQALICGMDLRGNKAGGAFNGAGTSVLLADCLGA